MTAKDWTFLDFQIPDRTSTLSMEALVLPSMNKWGRPHETWGTSSEAKAVSP